MGAFKVLIFGLPGSGKTTMANLIKDKLQGFKVEHFNADAVRAFHNDWDFSDAGRLRQAQRMRDYADNSSADIVICDFVAPLEKYREIFDPDLSIFMDTIKEGRFEDTNKVFERPINFGNYKITGTDNELYSTNIVHTIKTSI